MNLTKMAIARPIFMLMLMVGVVIGGLVSWRSMQLEQNPDVEFGVVTVSTVYPGAEPNVINELITRKVEDAVSEVNGIEEITASSQDGVSAVVVRFKIGMDMNAALSDIRAKVETIINELPDGAEKPLVDKINTTSEPILNLALSSKAMDNLKIRNIADKELKDLFSRIPGVASVSVFGGYEREIQVQVKKEKMLQYKLGLLDILGAISQATREVPSGRLVMPEQDLTVRVMGEFESIRELEELRISKSDPKNPLRPPHVLRLKDIATIVDSAKERRDYSRLNQNEAVVMLIQKTNEGNAVDISDAADKIIKKVEKDYGITMVKTTNSAEKIQESLSDLSFALFFGIFLVTAVIFVFLHNIRGTIIVAITIPTTLAAGVIAMKLFGFTINNLTMLALSLAIGVLVDDAIVVIENIYRHLKMGKDPVEAAIDGRMEIGLAAMTSALTNVVVFLPVAFMGGVVGQFLRPLAVVYFVVILLSLFVSFTITPMLAARWYQKGEDLENPIGCFARWFERMFEAFSAYYKHVLRVSLNHRWFAFLAGFAVLVAVFVAIGGSFQPDFKSAFSMAKGMFFFCTVLGATVMVVNIFRGFFKPRFVLFGALYGLFFIFSSVAGFWVAQWKGEAIFKFSFFPPSDTEQVRVQIEMAQGTSLASTEKVVRRIEGIVSKHPDVKFVLSTLGKKTAGAFAGSEIGSNMGDMIVTLHPKASMIDSLGFKKSADEKLRYRADTSVAADLLESIGKIPGAVIKVSASAQFGFGDPIQMSFSARDREVLRDTAVKIKEGLAQGAVPGLINVDISSKQGKPEVHVIPDRVHLANVGVTTLDLGRAMRVLYEGDKETKYREGGFEYDVRVMLDLEDRNNPETLNSMPLAFKQGLPVFLPSVADISIGEGIDKVDRRDRKEEIRITAGLLPGYAAGSVQASITQWLEKEKMLPPDVEMKPLGEADVQARESGYLFSALVIGFFLVYMLTASLYNNLLYPFIVQLAQPQALVGAILAIMFFDKTLNIVSFIGLIALVGLVGNHAILLVDYTNTLRGRGKERIEALIEAGGTRMRPIIMTTVSVLFGMLPVAMAIGRGSEFRETLGLVLIGGTLLSTALTLIVIPCSYTIFDDLSNSFQRNIKKILKRVES